MLFKRSPFDSKGGGGGMMMVRALREGKNDALDTSGKKK